MMPCSSSPGQGLPRKALDSKEDKKNDRKEEELPDFVGDAEKELFGADISDE